MYFNMLAILNVVNYMYLLFRCLYTQAQDTCEQTLDIGPWLTQAGGVKK